MMNTALLKSLIDLGIPEEQAKEAAKDQLVELTSSMHSHFHELYRQNEQLLDRFKGVEKQQFANNSLLLGIQTDMRTDRERQQKMSEALSDNTAELIVIKSMLKQLTDK